METTIALQLLAVLRILNKYNYGLTRCIEYYELLGMVKILRSMGYNIELHTTATPDLFYYDHIWINNKRYEV